MEKRKNRSLASIYRKPLPIALCVDEEGLLPLVIVHNPLSWIYLLCRMASIYVRKPPQAHVPLIPVVAQTSGGAVVFQVIHESDMEKLWKEGFFGKGTLSRSDPSWRLRVLRRLKLDSGIDSEVTNEEVTSVRREERKKFKELRSQAQKYETLDRQNKLSESDAAAWEKIKLLLVDTKNWKQEFKVQAGPEENSEVVLRQEDEEIIDLETMQLTENLEFLQLQKVEAFFLAFALDVVKVTLLEKSVASDQKSHSNELLTLSQIFNLCSAKNPNPHNKFILDYVVYHHFRSLGWCVRSGIKFGCDFLLYKRGPPFMHAEYALIVIPNTSEKWKDWEDFMSVSRVVGGVRKTLVLIYVDIPSELEFGELFSDNMDKAQFILLLQLYKVTEVISKRWAPSRTRD